MANKKSFDREKMYRKIMPTYYDNEEEQTKDENISGENADIKIGGRSDSKNDHIDDANLSLFKDRDLEDFITRDGKAILYNITEKLVLEKLDTVMDKMNCCKCDRCKMDIIALSLNNLEPHYVVKPKGNVDMLRYDQDFSQKVTSAVLKSALTVRSKPRH